MRVASVMETAVFIRLVDDNNIIASVADAQVLNSQNPNDWSKLLSSSPVLRFLLCFICQLASYVPLIFSFGQSQFVGIILVASCS